MKLSEAGQVIFKGNRRIFAIYREIKRGHNKGKIEIVLPERRIKVEPERVIAYPQQQSI